MGTRDILGEDDEIQPNGKMFKKLELGDYRLVLKRDLTVKLYMSFHLITFPGGGSVLFMNGFGSDPPKN